MVSRPTTTRRDNMPDHTPARSRLTRCPGSELTGDHPFAGIRLVAGPRGAGMPSPETTPVVIAPQRRLLDHRADTFGAGSLGRCTAPAT